MNEFERVMIKHGKDSIAPVAKGKSEQLQCFWGNLDGRRKGLVIAKTKKEAAQIVGIGMSTFNNYWSSGDFPAWSPIPRTLYTRPHAGMRVDYQVGLCPLAVKINSSWGE